jgi:predicted DNA-binding transcriptional regulator YafY
MDRLQRLFLILDLVNSKRNLTACDLAKECNVSERTIHKDIHALSGARVPIYFDEGYKLVNNSSFPTLSFTFDEYLTLYTGLNSGPVQSVEPLRKSAKRALEKLESSIPQEVRTDYEKAKEHITVRPEIKTGRQGPSLIFQLFSQASWPDKKVRLHYLSPESAEVVELALRGLLYKKGKWYLAGLVQKEIRYFRLDMIKDLSLA